MKDIRVSILIFLTIVLTVFPITQVIGVAEIEFSSKYNPFNLDNSKVSLVGYMCLVYPVNGEWIYLVDKPYQESPFYVTEETLFNSILVRAKKGEWFEYTDKIISVTGLLKVQEGQDTLGNPYFFEIVDAEYKELPFSDLSNVHKAYYLLSDEKIFQDFLNLISRLHAKVEFGFDKVPVGSDEFSSLIKRIEDLDPSAFSELVSFISDLEKLEAKINKEESESISFQIDQIYYNFIEWVGGFKR